MARRLIILRHAKSSWTSGATTDHARPLSGRGRRDAPRVGQRLAELGWIPRWVVSSDSLRTRETWRRLSRAFPGDIEIRFTPDLYHAGSSDIRAACLDAPAQHDTLMVIGHNPGWEDAVARFSGRYTRMTTCNAALLRSDADDWADAFDADWMLVDVLRPKEL